jgi:hypothetical protein
MVIQECLCVEVYVIHIVNKHRQDILICHLELRMHGD